MAALADSSAPVAATFASLPPALCAHVLARVPADARARAAAVHTSWHAALAHRAAWARLDLSASGGVTLRVTDGVLRAAAARAGGALTELDVSGCTALSVDALSGVLAANAGALRTLRAGGLEPHSSLDACLTCAHVAALLAVAPRLTLFEAGVSITVGGESPALLRGDPPFGPPLRVRRLVLCTSLDDDRDIALQQALALGAALRRVQPQQPQQQHARVVDPRVVELAAALRETDALAAFSMSTANVATQASAEALLRALEGHRSVRALTLHADASSLDAGVAAALGALVAADAPALTELHLHARALEGALAPLLAPGGLAANTHLRVLHCRSVHDDDDDEDAMMWSSDDDDGTAPAPTGRLVTAGDSLTRCFVRDALLPALRANTGLRVLSLDDASGAQHTEAAPAVELVRQRGGAERAAARCV
jgi:hypothetical protein